MIENSDPSLDRSFIIIAVAIANYNIQYTEIIPLFVTDYLEKIENSIVLINLLITSAGESKSLTRWPVEPLCQWNVHLAFILYIEFHACQAYRPRRQFILSESKSADKRNNSGAIDRPASMPLTEKHAHLFCGGRYGRRGDIGNYYHLTLLSCDIPGVAFISSDITGL